MPDTSTTLRRYSILTHRWLGVGFCALFTVWFVSGIVMMYWDFPRWSNVKRLPGLEAVDASRVRLSPADALARLGPGEPPSRVRLNMLGGRPAYRFHHGNRQSIVYADDGRVFTEVGEGEAGRIAAAWLDRQPDSARFDGVVEVDQWTVHPTVRPFGPFLKFSWPDAQQVYVSQVSGEVVQHTTRGERIGAWFGAIPHWLYFTPIRADPALWNGLVTWLSGIGTAMTVLGLVVGVWLYSPIRKRYRYRRGRTSVPYEGQKRWHMVLGLAFGLFAFTWGLSGMLSMGPISWLRANRQVDLANGLRGAVWHPEAFSQHPSEILAAIGPSLIPKELEFTFVGGEPYYLVTEALERSLLVRPHGTPQRLLDPRDLTAVIARSVSPHSVAEARVVEEYEPYYVDREFRHGYTLPALFARLDDPESSMYYVDLRTGAIAKSYGAGTRWNRWLYNGLHSFDVPWLYRTRPSWDLVVMVLMLGGTALCATSMVIGWRRLRHALRDRPRPQVV